MFRGLCCCFPFRLGNQIIRIVPLVRVYLSIGDFRYGACDAVQEVTIMGHQQEGTGIIL